MKFSIPRPRIRARVLGSLLMASSVSMLTVSASSAQALQPADAVPTTLIALPGLPTAPGMPPPMGVTLEQSRAAWNALKAPSTDLSAAPTSGISAVFMAPVGVLSVIGTGDPDTIVITRDAAGNLLVNNGTVPIQGPRPTVVNTTQIELFGQAGDDVLTLSEVNGALPKALLFGGGGNDVLTGGSGDDQLFGEGGSDTLLGKGGSDLLFGGAGKDQLTGGVGDDQAFGEAGDDTIIWNPGEGSDLNEGGDGTDTIQVNGGNGSEVFSLVPNGTRVRFDRVTPGPFFLDIGTSEQFTLNMNGGDDTFSGSNGLATLIKVTVDGGPGNDTILGTDGHDVLLGGDGNDFIDGQRGNDTVSLGADDDTFQWDPGDGSDVVDGQTGSDTLQFNGANIGEQFDLSANGARMRLTRNVGLVTMDTLGVEHVNLTERGGVDATTINDLSGTDVTDVSLDLAGTPGTGVGDGAIDTVTVVGTRNADTINVSGSAGTVSVQGASVSVSLAGVEPTDQLVVQGAGANDTLSASGFPSGVVTLTLDGGNGKDTITGSRGGDTLIGGAGDDTFIWNPGDGSDVVEGQDGADRLQFNGSAAGERFDLAANGTRVLLLRDIANIVMDVNGVERVELAELGGSDTTTVGDLTGTGVTNVQADLGGADTSSDSVTVFGTNEVDLIRVAGSSASVNVTGLAAKVTILGQEASDRLTVQALGGDDSVQASALAADAISLTLSGGRGNDSVIGSDGNDVFVWNPGDGSDTIEGQKGTDTMQFNGANIGELFDISANGTRVRLTRNVASIVMDINAVELINLVELGGADQTTIGDLTGTGVQNVQLGLDAVSGGGVGDGSADTVILVASEGDDVVHVSGPADLVSVSGVSTGVSITGAETIDRVVVNGLGGDDVLDGVALAPGGIGLTFDGGEGDDVLLGGPGNDVLLGGAGDDVLIGGPGQDVLDGGTGSNILIQD